MRFISLDALRRQRLAVVLLSAVSLACCQSHLARAADEAAQQQHVVGRPFRELVRCPRAREQVASLNRGHDEAKAVQRGQLRAPVRERNRCRRDVGNGAVRVGQLAINFAQQLCGDESGRGDDERVGLPDFIEFGGAGEPSIRDERGERPLLRSSCASPNDPRISATWSASEPSGRRRANASARSRADIACSQSPSWNRKISQRKCALWTS